MRFKTTWKWPIANETSFHNKNYGLSLAFKKRFKATRKEPNGEIHLGKFATGPRLRERDCLNPFTTLCEKIKTIVFQTGTKCLNIGVITRI